jgi:ribosome-associated protein
MPKKSVDQDINQMVDAIIDAMHEKKSKKVLSIDFANLRSSVCDFFLIAHADSTTQVAAIADHVQDMIHEKFGTWPAHQEGYDNAQWILLDYHFIVVHVFQTDYRKFYNLEGLWADALLVQHEDLKK